MFNYKKAKEILEKARKLGPEYEAAMRLALNTVYGKRYTDTDCFDSTSMYKQEMHDDCLPRRSGRYHWETDGLLYMESQEIIHDLENDIKRHMQNVYGIKNPKVTVNDNNEVTIDVHDGDYYITNVIFNDPATIVFWSDGTKTIVKCCEDDDFDEEKGLAMAVCKKVTGNNAERFHRGMRSWIKPVPEPEAEPSLSKLFSTWGDVVQNAINNCFDRYTSPETEQSMSKLFDTLGDATKKGTEYAIICPRCNNQINIPSKHDFFNNGGNTRCPNCGLEICMHTRAPL